MSWYTIFYLFSVADGLGTFFAWLAGISTLGLIISMIISLFVAMEEENMSDDEKDTIKKFRRWIWRFSVMCIIGWLGIVLLPSKKDMLMIVAGGAVGEFLTTDTSAKKLPADLTQYLHKAIQKEVAEMDDVSPEVKNALGVASPKEQYIDKIKDLTKEEILERLKSDTTLIK